MAEPTTTTPDDWMKESGEEDGGGGGGEYGLMGGPATSETQITEEIESLARGLLYDPLQMFLYVRNNIEYVPQFGLRNGATATLLAKRGNDLDQCALLIALLKAANPTTDAHYVEGNVTYGKIFLSDLLGVDPSQTPSFLAVSGIPVTNLVFNAKVVHYWVEATIDGVNRVLDPAFKRHTFYEPVTNLLGSTGYNRTQFLARALSGATEASNSVKSVNEANIRADLTTYTTNLLSYLKANYPNASVRDVFGGKEIYKLETNALPTELPNAIAIEQQNSYTTLPTNLMARIRFQHQGIDKTMKVYEFAGKRVTIFYTGSGNAPELRVDSTNVATGSGTTTGMPYTLTATIIRPNASDASRSFTLTSGKAYVMANNFGAASSDLIARQSDQLAQYRASGLAETNENVMGETLHLMSLTYEHQETLQSQLAGSLLNVFWDSHYFFGLMAQEKGYYIDIPMSLVGMRHKSGTATNEDAWFRLGTLFASALEHGMLEQMQGLDKPGVSTIKLLGINNARTTETYWASSSNWLGAGGVRSKLTNYSAGELSNLDTYIVTNGMTGILPKNGSIPTNQWAGAGYTVYDSSSIAMLISGGYNGGYSASQGTVQSQPAQYQTTVAYTPSPYAYISPTYASDPVDMNRGQFYFANPDSVAANSEPWGLSFRRYYSSGNNLKKGYMGHGWRHNYDIRANKHSYADPALGSRQPSDAAAQAVSILVSADLLGSNPELKHWLTASIAAKWAMDQLTDNAVTIEFGDKSVTYIKQPNRRFTLPPATTTELEYRDPYQWGFTGTRPVSGDFDGDGKSDLCVYNSSLSRWYYYESSGSNYETNFGSTNGIPVVADYDGDGKTDLATLNTNTFHWIIRRSSDNVIVTQHFGYGGCVPVQGDYDGDGAADYAVFDASITKWYVSQTTSGYSERVFGGGGSQAPTPVPADYDGDGRLNIATYDWNVPSIGYRWSILRSNGTTNYILAGTADTSNPMAADFDGDGIAEPALLVAYYNIIYVYDASGSGNDLVIQGGGTNSHRLTGDYNGDGKDDAVFFDEPTGYWYIEGISDAIYRLLGRFGSKVIFTAFDRIGVMENADRASVQFYYDYTTKPGSTNLFWVQDTANHTAQLSYNSATQLSAATVSGITTYYSYTSNNLVTFTDRGGNNWTYTYDNDHRILTLANPLGQITLSNSYNALGIVQTQRNANSNLWNLYIARGYRAIEEDPRSNRVTYFFDRDGRQTIRSDALSNTVYTYYDGQGHATNVVDARGGQTAYQYDGSHNVTGVVNALGQRTEYTYDSQHRLTTLRDALGFTTTFDYDSKHHVTGVVDALAQRISTTYYSNGLPRTVTDPRSNTATFAYDGYGLVASVQRTDGGVEYRTNDVSGNLLSITDPNSNTTVFAYDSRRLLISQKDALGYTASNVYNAIGLPTSVRDRNGNITSNKFTPTYQLDTAYNPDGGQVVYRYDERDLLVSVTDPLGRTASNRYDAAGRLVQVIDPLGHGVTNTYDANGNLIRVQDALGNSISNQFDALNRLTKSVDALGAVTSNRYDELGRVTATIDALGAVMEYQYDALGRRTQSKRPGNVIESFDYDPVGNLSQYVNGLGAIYHYSYDGMNRVVAETNAIGLGTQYAYSPGGTRTSRLDANGKTTTYSYDGVNNLKTVGYSDGQTNRFNYDGNRNLTNMVDALGTTTYRYDKLNRLVSCLDRHGNLVSNVYDVAGLRRRLVYPDGKQVGYGYDEANRLTSVTDWVGRVTSFGYNNADALTGITYPNTVVASRSLDNMYRVVGYGYQAGSSTIVSRTMTRNLGGLKSREDILAGLEGLPQSQTVEARSHDLADRIMDVAARTAPDAAVSSVSTHYHDNNGNIVSNNSGRSLLYDLENRLTNHLASGVQQTFAYDALGNRTMRSLGGTNSIHVLDCAASLHNVLMEKDTNGNPVAYYVWGKGLVSMTRIQGGQTNTYFAHADELGSTLALTDTNGVLTDAWFYEPYGELISRTGSTANPFTFIGGFGVYAEASGLYHMKARYFDSGLKRFINVDPLGLAGGKNLYGYVGGNPLAYIDPRGKCRSTQNTISGYGSGMSMQDYSVMAYGSTVSYDPSGGSDMMKGGVAVSAAAGAVMYAATVPLVVATANTVGNASDIYTTVKDVGAFVANPSMAGAANLVVDAASIALPGSTASSTKLAGDAVKATPTPHVAPDFVVTPKGEAIPIPSGATGPYPTRSPGVQYTGGSGGHGLDPRTANVRVMEPTAQYPGGYVNYGNAQVPSQSVNPYTGQTISPSDPSWHIPLQ